MVLFFEAKLISFKYSQDLTGIEKSGPFFIFYYRKQNNFIKKNFIKIKEYFKY